MSKTENLRIKMIREERLNNRKNKSTEQRTINALEEIVDSLFILNTNLKVLYALNFAKSPLTSDTDLNIEDMYEEVAILDK